jgi:hypothetical protein
MKINEESNKEFVSDVIDKKDELRLIKMEEKKFVDEYKEYIKKLNEFRKRIKKRLNKIEN